MGYIVTASSHSGKESSVVVTNVKTKYEALVIAIANWEPGFPDVEHITVEYTSIAKVVNGSR